MEEYRTIEGFEEYSVSNQGHIRNRHGRLLRTHQGRNGYLFVTLQRDGTPHTRGVSTLVARAFLENPNPRRFASVLHIDLDYSNVNVENLAWRPRWFIYEYRDQINWPNKGITRPIIEVDSGIVYDNCWHAANTLGLIAIHISQSIWDKTRVFPTMHKFEIQ